MFALYSLRFGNLARDVQIETQSRLTPLYANQKQ